MRIVSIDISDLSITQEQELMDKLHEFFPLVAFDDDTIKVDTTEVENETLTNLSFQEDYIISKALAGLKVGTMTSEEIAEDLTNDWHRILEHSLTSGELETLEKLLQREQFDPYYND
jgi:hypothetical protein